ncbi:MAG: prephenate dehydrogenase/arogenate dehydrogenase family protein [Gammaproteobacteria bacterium]|nr:prephenate dehydrogenase/arogenate dehydrogenase family protein [Gammaproteobacteria bacterium]
MIHRLTIVGVGLIGGSLAAALRQAGYVGEIVGHGRNRANLDRALELGVVDRITLDLAEAVEGADMVVVAVPLGAIRSTLEVIAAAAPVEAVITDVGSAKVMVVEVARSVLGEGLSRFVPGHPVAGGEQSGVAAARAELFVDHKVILTPTAETDTGATTAVREMWSATGATVMEMPAGHHDQVLAATSHLPHMLAYGLVAMLSRLESEAEVFEFAAGGFRDFTRIASSDPVMWRDICLANGSELTTMIDDFIAELKLIQGAVDGGDGTALLDEFAFAKSERDRFMRQWPKP